jgi:hypothetical protein
MSYKDKKVKDLLKKRIKEVYSTNKEVAKILGITAVNFSYKINNPSAKFIRDLIKIGIPTTFDEIEKVTNINQSQNINNSSGESDMVNLAHVKVKGNLRIINNDEKELVCSTCEKRIYLEKHIIMLNEIIKTKDDLIKALRNNKK